jgi:hypothetical protein
MLGMQNKLANPDAVLPLAEHIAAALLKGRTSELPGQYQHPLDAIAYIAQQGPDWIPTLLAVHQRDRKPLLEMYEERLP